MVTITVEHFIDGGGDNSNQKLILAIGKVHTRKGSNLARSLRVKGSTW